MTTITRDQYGDNDEGLRSTECCNYLILPIQEAWTSSRERSCGCASARCIWAIATVENARVTMTSSPTMLHAMVASTCHSIRKTHFHCVQNFGLENLGLNGGIILKWILGKWDRVCGLDSSGSGYGPVAGFCEHGDGPCGFIKGGDILRI